MSQGIDPDANLNNELDDSNQIVLFSGSMLSAGPSPFSDEPITKDKSNLYGYFLLL